MSTLNRIVAEIKYNQVYTCQVCGRKQVGVTRHTKVDCASTAELSTFLESQQLLGHYMPVGWVSYHNRITCGCDTPKQEG
jgi:hypothetical protein